MEEKNQQNQGHSSLKIKKRLPKKMNISSYNIEQKHTFKRRTHTEQESVEV